MWPGARWSYSAATGDPEATAAALDMLTTRLVDSRRCVLLVGHEVQSVGYPGRRPCPGRSNRVAVASVSRVGRISSKTMRAGIGIYHGMGSAEAVRAFVEELTPSSG